MLQRLGLAQALLGRPRYLFLDEPMSGVDPEGVVLFRRLLGEAKAQGSTVVLNSHNLDEVERACDRVAFVRGGRVEAVETPMAGAGQARILKVRARGEWLRTAGASEAVANAAARAGAKVVEISASGARFDVADDDRAARLLGALIEAGMPVTEATPEGGRLERLFLGPKEGGTP
jgi:ABC-type multidrug transport system ATPase subunit